MTTQNSPIVMFGKHKDMDVFTLIEMHEGYCDWVLGLQISGQSSTHVDKLCTDIKNCKQIIKQGLLLNDEASKMAIDKLKKNFGTETGSLPQKKKKFASGGVVGSDVDINGASYSSIKNSIPAVLSKGDVLHKHILKAKGIPKSLENIRGSTLGDMLMIFFPEGQHIPIQFTGHPLDSLVLYKGKIESGSLSIHASMYDRDNGEFIGGASWLN